MASSLKDDIMTGAWAACIRWAANTPEAVAAFNQATGHRMGAKLTPIDMLIDKATGHDETVAYDFVDWVTDNYWGYEEAPESYRKDRARRREHERNRPRKKRTGSN